MDCVIKARELALLIRFRHHVQGNTTLKVHPRGKLQQLHVLQPAFIQFFPLHNCMYVTLVIPFFFQCVGAMSVSFPVRISHHYTSGLYLKATNTPFSAILSYDWNHTIIWVWRMFDRLFLGRLRADYYHHTIRWQSVCMSECQGGNPIGKALVY